MIGKLEANLKRAHFAKWKWEELCAAEDSFKMEQKLLDCMPIWNPNTLKNGPCTKQQKDSWILKRWGHRSQFLTFMIQLKVIYANLVNFEVYL